VLTQDELKAIALLVALALLGAGVAHIDARHPRILTLTLGDSLALGRPAAGPEADAEADAQPPSSNAGDAAARTVADRASSPSDTTSGAASPAGSTSSIDLTGRIDVNRASAAELELLPGVGPKMAERIVEERTLRGRFKRPRDLRRVKGIGEKTLARLLPYVRTDSAADSARTGP
jgi:competence protein ComEA